MSSSPPTTDRTTNHKTENTSELCANSRSDATSPLMVAPHVRLRHCDGTIVMLDLRRGRYMCLSARAAAALAGHVSAWPVSSDEAGPAASLASPAACGLVQRLLALNILSDALPQPWPQSPSLSQSPSQPPRQPQFQVGSELVSQMQTQRHWAPDLPDPTGSIEPADHAAAACGARRVGQFLRSTAVAAWWLRVSSLHTIARRVIARHERLAAPRGANESLPWHPHAPPPPPMQSAALLFDRLRPLAFSARDRCLHDSLAMTLFLASEGHRARWVIGVKLNPFGAHSWVQWGRTVLNDQHEYVRAFRPILVV